MMQIFKAPRGGTGRLALVAMVAAGASLASATAASAAPTTCNGVIAGTVKGNVTVPAGATCELNPGTSITGNVMVGKEATLFSPYPPVMIGGNVQANSSRYVLLSGVTVAGNVQAQGLTGPFVIVVSTVGGNLQAQNNAGRVGIATDAVKGNIEVHNNTGGGELLFNSAGGNCFSFNNNPPLGGTGNTAGPKHQNTCPI